MLTCQAVRCAVQQPPGECLHEESWSRRMPPDTWHPYVPPPQPVYPKCPVVALSTEIFFDLLGLSLFDE